MRVKPIRSVYLLIDPRTLRPFYVGVSTSPDKRFRTHCTKYGKRATKPTPTQKVINEILLSGLHPQMVIVQQIATFDKNEAFALEKQWIDRMVETGNVLTNRRISGEVWYGKDRMYYFDDNGIRRMGKQHKISA